MFNMLNKFRIPKKFLIPSIVLTSFSLLFVKIKTKSKFNNVLQCKSNENDSNQNSSENKPFHYHEEISGGSFHLKTSSGSPTDISYVTHTANDPIEDRYNLTQLNSIPGGGVYLAVFDGHGGFQMSEYANSRLHKVINEKFAELYQGSSSNKNITELTTEAIKQGFAKVEQEFYNFGLNQYRSGNGRLATVGSCALVAIILEKEIIIANLGDSKAKLYKKISDKEYSPIRVMDRHNSEKPKEIEKLRKNFPNDSDIVVCKRPNMKVCYVKGRLQPTRSFGDFHLKYKEFNENTNDSNSMYYRKSIKNFNGPYISAEPEIRVFDYSKGDLLVLATDGLWDEMNTKEIFEVMNKDLTSNLANNLLYEALSKAANNIGYSVEQLNEMAPGGRKRRIHDDINIIVAKL